MEVKSVVDVAVIKKIFMNYKICFLLALLSAGLNAQEREYQMLPNSPEAEIDFLFSYYHQDGNNSPVTGGIGTEELSDYSSSMLVQIPLDSSQSLNLSANADYYTSASTDNIDRHVSSESIQDVRTYGNIGYSKKNFRRGETYGINLGLSTEYDYVSFSGGIQFSKQSRDGNREFAMNAQAFIDQWSLYFPQELRGKVSVNTKSRRSYNLQMSLSQVINQRLQMSISGEVIYMEGLLSTPFHRVYFANNQGLDIERLPNKRIKVPLSLRLNYFPNDRLVLRSYYRFYADDFDIQGHTAMIEVPYKLDEAWTISPFFRYHSQSGSKYFAGFEEHSADSEFYSSDYDLSDLHSQKIGVGIRYSPSLGLSNSSLPLSNKTFSFKSIHLRGAYFQRSTDLKSYVFSMGLSFGIR